MKGYISENEVLDQGQTDAAQEALPQHEHRGVRTAAAGRDLGGCGQETGFADGAAEVPAIPEIARLRVTYSVSLGVALTACAMTGAVVWLCGHVGAWQTVVGVAITGFLLALCSHRVTHYD